MRGLNNQVWVTSALTNEEVRDALVLCYSLKRAFTSRRVAVIVSPKVTTNLRETLYYAFDLVFYAEEDRNTAQLKLEDFTKVSALAILRTFERCVYLSPSRIAVRNADEIFNEYDDPETKGFGNFVLPENLDTSIFLFKPSYKLYQVLQHGFHTRHVTGKPITDIGAYLQTWTRNQLNGKSVVLRGKYNHDIQNGGMLLGNEKDISIVNLPGIDPFMDGLVSEKFGLLGKRILNHWLDIYKENVQPLIEQRASASMPPSSCPSYATEPVAIVGMSCRFPGSNNVEEFWNMLFAGEDGTGNPPPFRWLREQCWRPRPDCKKTNAGFLKVPVDTFDAKFFGLSPKEMLFMDPQHRLIHELVWEGLEDACIDAHSLKGTPGSVFVGSWINDYKDILLHSGNDEFYRAYMGNSIGAAAARISHLLEIVGPSIATESGCSSAMVAVHLACRSLLLGESNLALACGVNLLLHPFDKDVMPMVISPDGHCKTFCENANGFARAEGCGVLVLKRLSDAVKDGDNIWALIRGSAMNQEGVSKSMGTPTVHCESMAMIGALRDAHVNPAHVSYVEAHGTGTVVGDPMEVAAIAKAYNSPERKEPLIIGSVKTNVGHTESCSGITGIMKVVLAMAHERIPAHRNFEKLNPAIDLSTVPARIPLEVVEWKAEEGRPRVAGVSSFGITGTDAHVIVEEPPSGNKASTVLKFHNELERPLHILKVSAKTEEALDILLENIHEKVGDSEMALEDIAYACNAGRANFSQRAVIIAKSKEDLVGSIKQNKYLRGEVSEMESQGKICFLFTGQGSQYPGMVKTLYETSPTFRIHFDHCEKILRGRYNIKIKDVMWGSSSSEISRTIYSQTSIFCVEYALLKLWESWGVKPNYVLGHSLGEFAAAVCAGILNVEDALMLVAERSRLIDQLARGKMLVIKADEEKVDCLMKRFANDTQSKILDYAAVNSTQQTVVAGDSSVILDFHKFCTENGLKCTILEATHAFHSRHMNPILKDYRKVALSTQEPSGANCEYISGMRGKLVKAEDVGADYWVEHTREKVSFLDASRNAVELGCKIFIEIGPQPVLSALTMMNNDEQLLCLPSLKKNEDEWSTLLNTLGKLYVHGLQVDWEGFDQFYLRKKVRLPTYPFLGKKFWPDMMALTGQSIHPLIGSCIPNASSTKIFQCGINLTTHEWIKDHAIGTNVVFPGAGYLEMCLAAGFATTLNSIETLGKPGRAMKVEGLRIEAPLALEEGKTSQVQVIVNLNASSEDRGDWNDMTVQIFHRVESESGSSWLSHGKGVFSPLLNAEEQQISFDKEILQHSITRKCDDELVTQVYEKLATIGLKFGPIFRSLESVWKEKSGLLAKVKMPTQDEGQSNYIVHPAVLDAMIQAVMMLKLTDTLRKKLYVPIKIGKFLWLRENSTEDSYIYAYDTGEGSGEELSTSTCTALLLDGNGHVLGVMSGVEFIDTTVKAIEAVLEQQLISMPDLWEEVWRGKPGPLQHSQDLEICNGTKFYDDDFLQNLIKEYNVLGDELQTTFEQLEKLVYYNILRAMYECGMSPPQKGSVLNGEELFNELGIEKDFKRLFGYFLQVFQDEGILIKGSADEWIVSGVFPTLPEIVAELSSQTYTKDLVRKFNVTLLFSKLGENLSKILTGKQSPLYILFPDESSKKEHPSVANFYDEYAQLFRIQNLVVEVATKWLEHCKSRSPEKFIIRLLEIGAGTGKFTSTSLDVVEKLGVDVEYTYTDISAAFFPPAEKRFEKWSKVMSFKKLNIEEDPISQGFTPEYFDLICASDVIHATKDIKETLKNVNILLKPTGRFDLMEMTRVNRFITYLFGLLDGFWRFEDSELRPFHCTLTTNKWTEALVETGFEVVGAFPCVNNYHSYICSRKVGGIQMELPPLKGSKSWLIFHQRDSPISNFLVEKIPSLANRPVLVVEPSSNKFSVLKEDFYNVRKDSESDFISLMESIAATGTTLEGVVYCWTLDKNGLSQDDVLQPYFYLVKSIISLKKSGCPRLVTLCDGTVPVEDNHMGNLHPSTVWGLTKSLKNENIDLNTRCVDIGGCGQDEEDVFSKMQIFYEIFNTVKDIQAAYYGRTRYTPKFQMHKMSVNDLKLPPGTDRFQLILPETKSIGDLQFGPLDPLILRDEEIEIQVKASALNFRDVFSVLKPSEKFKDINAVGFDLAGVVKRVGGKVIKWKVGDPVFGVNVHGDALPSHVKLGQDDLLPIPEDMTFCDAATLPAVFATAYYCLIDVAKVTDKDTVLIHTASGGVGLSAIELCKHLGAKIICTAGSKRKQNYLRSLGIQHIFHSRNTKYGKQILELTGGRGVDVVLNSLTSEGFKEATLMACAKNARFVEMSKLSIWEPEEVRNIRPDVNYTIVDVASVDVSEWRRLMTNLKNLADKKVVSPIPYVRFHGVNIREALQYMQKAKHIGKVVCVMPEVRQKNGVTTADTPMFNDKSTYLITGGLGGIGFVVCQWMVEKGARFVLLAGRNPPSSSIQENIRQINTQYGAKVTPVKLDVGNFQQCKELIKKGIAEMSYPPLRGVMHCAGILNDGLISNQDWVKLSSTLSTKVDGTLNLHELTKDLRLEHFVLFSSIAALFGSPGQSNHAAGNNFEDTFAHYRNSMGLPATTINWGQWGQVGVATEVDLPGLKPFSNMQGIAGLEYALKSQRTQTGVINIDSFVLLSKLFPHISTYLDERVWKSSGSSSGSSLTIKCDEFWQQYDSKEDFQGKTEILQEQLRAILKSILKLDESDVIQEDQDFQEMGVDSLMFVEIKNGLQSLLGERITVSASALRDCNNVKLLSETLVKLIEGDDSLVESSQPPTAEEVKNLIREDCILPEHIRAKDGMSSVGFHEIACVLLTGCTGTFGPYILRELVRLPQIARVVCLIRPRKDKCGEERLRNILEERGLSKEIDMRKVLCVTGDVASEKLGMETGVWEELSEQIDAIFHCAASVQHVEHYRKRQSPGGNDMRSVNISGTKNVLEFSCSGSKLKHVFNASSLLAVANVDENGVFSEEWPNIGDFDGVTTVAYPITKFVGDVLLKEAVLERGIPAKVFRFPFIVGESETGRFVLSQNHIMLRYLFILKTGLMPSNPFPMNMLPVDVCAKVGVQLFFDSRWKNDVLNIIHDKPDVDQGFVGVAEKLGYELGLVEFAEFAQKLRETTTEDSPFAIFKEFYRDDRDVMALYTSVPVLRHWAVEGGSEEGSRNMFYSRKTEKLIPHFYKKLERTMEYVHRDLLFARKQGWLKKYGLN